MKNLFFLSDEILGIALKEFLIKFIKNSFKSILSACTKKMKLGHKKNFFFQYLFLFCFILLPWILFSYTATDQKEIEVPYPFEFPRTFHHDIPRRLQNRQNFGPLQNQ